MIQSASIVPSPAGRTQEGFNVREFINDYLLRYWYLYVIGIGIACITAWFKIKYTTPIYQIKSTLLLKFDDQNTGASATSDLILRDFGLNGGTNNAFNEIQILKSRPLMEEVIKTLGLDVEYYIEGRFRTNEIYPANSIKVSFREPTPAGYNVPFTIKVLDKIRYQLLLNDHTSEHNFGEILAIPEGKFIFTFEGDSIPPANIIIYFRKPALLAADCVRALNVNLQNVNSTLLDMAYTTPVPAKGIEILNTLVTLYNKATVDDKNMMNRNTMQFIDERLKYLTRELNDVDGDLEQYKRSNQIPAEIESSLTQLIDGSQEYDKEQSSLEIQKSILDALEAYLKNQLTQYESAPVNLLPQNPQVASLISQYNIMILERARQLRSATADHPAVQMLTEQINGLRASILNTIDAARRELETMLVSVRAKNDFYQSRIGSIPTQTRGLIEIKRQQGIKENLFLYLLQKREETALTMAVAVPNSRLVDPPIQVGNALSPNKRSIFLLHLILGLFIPFLLLYLRYQLTYTVQAESDISAVTSTPLLGTINFQRSKDSIVVTSNSRSAIAEMFRLLRTNLQFLTANQRNQVLLVTSSVSGEGKSFVTLNLGITLALADKKTVIVELDLRKPKLIKYLNNKPGDKGLSHYLIGKAEYEAVVQASGIHPNLFYVSSGPIPPNPAELLLTENIERFVEQLRAHFDHILLDTPPVGLVADAFLLGRLTDSSLYVVRQQYSHKDSLNLIDEIYREQKLPRLALIFNGVKAKGGYGRQAGYGYYEEQEKRPWWKRLLG